LVDFVRDLKTRPGGDIGVHGSISVGQAPLSAGLVDELRLIITPAIAAPGENFSTGRRRPASPRSEAWSRRPAT
jgi:dihydrofolate reductase